jgi:hypothetical protein
LRGTSSQHLQNILHANTHSPDAGTTSALGWIESNALHAHTSTPTRSPRQPRPGPQHPST